MKFLSDTDYEAVKTSLIGKDPLMKKVALAEVSLDGLAEPVPYIGLSDKKLRVESSFLPSLAKHMRINKMLLGKFRVKNSKGRKVDDTASQLALIQGIKSYVQRNKAEQIVLLAGHDGKSLEGVTRAENYGRVTNEGLFTIAETLMNGTDKLKIDSIDRRGGGGLSINLVCENPVNIGFGDDETFNFGFTLRSTFTATSLGEYNRRLVCTNGMSTRFDKKLFGITQANEAQLGKLFGQLGELRRNQYMPLMFKDAVEKAMATSASVAECETMYDEAKRFISEQDHTVKTHLELAMRDTHFPGIRMAKERLAGKKKFLDDMTQREKAYVRSGMTVWDVINAGTYLASNQTGIDMGNATSLKMTGGNLLTKGAYDLAHADLFNL